MVGGQSAKGAGQATKTRGAPAIRRLPRYTSDQPASPITLLSTMYRRYGWYLTHGLISILLFVSCFPFSIFFPIMMCNSPFLSVLDCIWGDLHQPSALLVEFE